MVVRTVEQADVDFLVRDVEAMKKVLVRDPKALRPQLEAMIWRARDMQTRAAGGRFEHSIKNAHYLLMCLKQGIRFDDPHGMRAAG